METMTEVKREAALGNKIWEVQVVLIAKRLKTNPEYERTKNLSLEALKTGKAPWFGQFIEVGYNSQNEGKRVLQSVVYPIYSDKGCMLCGITRDITEKKKAEEELRLQSAALDSAANGIVITDKAGMIVWVNPAFCALTGYSSTEVIGKNPRFLKSSIQTDDFYARLWETISAGEVWRGVLTNQRKDGKRYIAEMVITPVKNGENRDQPLYRDSRRCDSSQKP